VAFNLELLAAQGGEAGLHAGCRAAAAKILDQGALMVIDPGSAYAMAMLALAVGHKQPALWPHLQTQFRAACCYTVPHYVKRPEGASDTQYALLMGYAQRGKGLETKEKYYNRMAGFVTLYGALLQAERVPISARPCGNSVDMRPATNGLGAPAAWAWLARLLNQKPQRITATVLLAFLKPTAPMLASHYTRQFGKLLRFVKAEYVPRLRSLVETLAAKAGSNSVVEERAAVAVLETWLDGTLTAFVQGRGQLPPPEDHGVMPDFKQADDTTDRGGEDW